MAAPAEQKTFYEVLDVPRNAKANDIALAYKRLLARMRSETVPPNPRLLAAAKVAHETLMDPERRAEYDQSIGVTRRAGRGSGRGLLLGGLLLVLAGAGAAYYVLIHKTKPAASAGATAPSQAAATPAEDILHQVSPWVGRFEVALMSGEVRQPATAVALGEGEMAVPCTGIVPGAHLGVLSGATRSKAELARSNAAADACILTVRSAPTGARLRTGVPPATEKLVAVVFDAKGDPAAKPVAIARSLDDPNGVRLEVKTAAPLPDGTPIFDAQARLVGFMSSAPGGVASALGAARFASLRPTPSTVAGATARTPASPGPSAAEPATPAATPAPAAPATRGGGLGTMVGEGFTTLWREDDEGQISEVLDDAKKGYIGLPLAYWTRWEGRDPRRPMIVGCRITLNGEVPIYAYEQRTEFHDADGYFYCALAPTMMDLNNLVKGEYTFEIFVNGRPLAENSIRVERRIMTPTAWMVIVLAVGLGLLAFLRRNKVVS